MPLAHSVIGNQAAATYHDASGTVRSVNSNMVQTTVAQVGAFSISGDNDKSGVAGNVVYMPHTIYNDGNGTDTFRVRVHVPVVGSFAAISIFPDGNGTGVPSSSVPLCSGDGEASCIRRGFEQAIAGNHGAFSFLVAYTLKQPVFNRTEDLFIANVRVFPVSADSALSATYAPNQRASIDNVRLTQLVALSLSSKIGPPAVDAPVGRWPVAISSGMASGPDCPTNWSATLVENNPNCRYTVQTARYTNSGMRSGVLTFRTELPAGFRFVSGSAVWSHLPGALSEGGVAMESAGAGSIRLLHTAAENALAVIVDAVPPNTSGTFSFVVLVAEQAIPGTTGTGFDYGYFSSTCNPMATAGIDESCGGSGPSAKLNYPVRSNRSEFTVLPHLGVVLASAPSREVDTASPPDKAGVNQIVVSAIQAGGVVAFRNVVTNTGNGTDTFNLQLPVPGQQEGFPLGTVYRLLGAAGGSPLTDSNQDGITDTGPIFAGESKEIWFHAELPVGTNAGTGPFHVLLTAGSVQNSSVSDAVWNSVTAVTGALFDLTSSSAGNQVVQIDGNGVISREPCDSGLNCDLGPGPTAYASGIAQTALGDTAVYSLFLSNNDTQDNSYSFQPQLPSGWLVKLIAGAVGAQSPDCEGPPIVQPVSVAAGGQRQVIACVTAPVNSPVGRYAFTLTAQSNRVSGQGVSVADTISLEMLAMSKPSSATQLLPSTATIPMLAGSVFTQRIALRNSGTESCATGTAGFDADLQLDARAQAAGWTATVYLDRSGDGALDAMSLPLGPASGTAPGNVNRALTAAGADVLDFSSGAILNFLIQLSAPAMLPPFSVADYALSIHDLSVSACPSANGAYRAQVSGQQVRIRKTQALNADCQGEPFPLNNLAQTPIVAAPGQCIVYQVEVVNVGASVLRNVSVDDSISTYTHYTVDPGRQPDIQCEAHNLEGDQVSLLVVPTNGPVASLRCTSEHNTLPPAGSIVLRYSVQIDH